jgi:hypothetical protein
MYKKYTGKTQRTVKTSWSGCHDGDTESAVCPWCGKTIVGVWKAYDGNKYLWFKLAEDTDCLHFRGFASGGGNGNAYASFDGWSDKLPDENQEQ